MLIKLNRCTYVDEQAREGYTDDIFQEKSVDMSSSLLNISEDGWDPKNKLVVSHHNECPRGYSSNAGSSKETPSKSPKQDNSLLEGVNRDKVDAYIGRLGKKLRYVIDNGLKEFHSFFGTGRGSAYGVRPRT